MSYVEAKAKYAALGIDTDAAIAKLKAVPVALHCWQGDDVRGFDTDPTKPLTGGIQTTGNYPGRARTPEELMADLDLVIDGKGHTYNGKITVKGRDNDGAEETLTIKNINFDDYAESIPAFITIVMMPLAYSISDGILLGMISYVVLNVLCGNFKRITPTMYILAVMFILKYIFI